MSKLTESQEKILAGLRTAWELEPKLLFSELLDVVLDSVPHSVRVHDDDMLTHVEAANVEIARLCKEEPGWYDPAERSEHDR